MEALALFSTIEGIVMAYVAYRWANKVGKNGIMWAILGFIFSAFTLLYIVYEDRGRKWVWEN